MLGKWVCAWYVQNAAKAEADHSLRMDSRAIVSAISTFSRGTEKWRVAAQPEPLDSSRWVYA